MDIKDLIYTYTNKIKELDKYYDTEEFHIYADVLMCEILNKLGFDEFVAIFVNNLASAAAGEGFAGLNPFPAFVNHLDALLILYLLLMIFIFVSCMKVSFYKKKDKYWKSNSS